MTEQVHREKIEVNGEDLLSKFKELVHEGNIRKVTILNEEGKQIVEIPLTMGVVGALLLPSLAAIGAIAAIVTKCTLEIERVEESDPIS
jgi:aryl-alcohol dehydrogenase-like predicted oxidoreductase